MTLRVAVTLTSFAEYDSACLDILKKAGLKIVHNTFRRKLNKKEALELCKDCVGILAGTEIYDRDTLERLPEIKVISRCGAGKDNIDLEATEKLGIKIYTTPDAPTIAVAELSIGLTLALLRKIALMDRELRHGIWKKRMGSLLFGKRVGIVGFGRIGHRVAEIHREMGAIVNYADPFVKDKGVFKRIRLKELLKKSDIVSLHLSYSKRSVRLIGFKELSSMKQGAFLINCSRGGIVDEEALFSVLNEGRLGGAAIDVFEREPYTGPLKNLDNAILTPHIGSYAKEARIKMETKAAKNLLAGLKRNRKNIMDIEHHQRRY